MPALTWRPDAWRSFSNNPTAFMDAFRQLKKPTSNLHGETYLKCAENGFRVLEKHPQYHAEYFEGLIDKLPPSVIPLPEKYTLQYSRNSVESTYARIESLLWHDAISQHWTRKKEDEFHWVLTLQRRYGDYDVLLKPHAPAWAHAYVEIQRDGYSKNWSSWYNTYALNQVLPVLIALGRSHIAFNKEDPAWLREAMARTYERLRHEPEAQQLPIHQCTDFLDIGLHAGGHATAIMEWACRPLDRNVPKMSNYHLMESLWYGQRLHSTPEGVARFQAFWDNLQPIERGRLLSSWYSTSSAWKTLDSRIESDSLCATLVSKPVEFFMDGQDHGLGFLKSCGLNTPEVLDFITGVLPFTRPILDMIGPDEFLAYTTTHWSTLRAVPTMLGLDSLAIDT